MTDNENKDLQTAEEIIGNFFELIAPLAQKIIDAYVIVVLNDAFELERKARENNEKFIILNTEKYEKIYNAILLSNSGGPYMNSFLAEAGFDHFLIKNRPCFKENTRLPEPHLLTFQLS